MEKLSEELAKPLSGSALTPIKSALELELMPSESSASASWLIKCKKNKTESSFAINLNSLSI